MKILAVFVLLQCAVSWAQTTPTIPTVIEHDVLTPRKKSFVMEERRYWAMMGAALDFRIERDQEQNTDLTQAPSFSAGVGYQHFLGVLEYSTLDEDKNGNKTLNTKRSSENAILWGQYYTDDEWKFRPFFGLGVGARRDRVVTNFYDQQSEDTGKWSEIFGGAFGFRWAAFAPIWLTIEGRVLFSRDFDPSPALGGLFKIGFVLE